MHKTPDPVDVAIGALVIYARDPYYLAAQNTYFVLGEAKPDPSSGKPRFCIQAISRRTIFKPGVTRFEPMTVRVSDCIPIAAFGIRIDKVVRKIPGHAFNHLLLVRDPAIVSTDTRKWGRPIGAAWDHMLSATIDDDGLAKLVADALAAEAGKIGRAA